MWGRPQNRSGQSSVWRLSVNLDLQTLRRLAGNPVEVPISRFHESVATFRGGPDPIAATAGELWYALGGHS
jgi:hypothetical protein